MGTAAAPPELVLMFPCGCGTGFPVFYPADQLGQVVRCPHTNREMHVIGSVFGAAAWEQTTRSDALRACVAALGIELSARKLRFCVCHWSRGPLSPATNKNHRAALDLGERWAETGVRPPEVKPLRERIDTDHRYSRILTSCIADTPGFPPGDTFGSAGAAASDCFRDVVPNPFVPLEWHPEWFTSTVRGLAAHTYESRDFSAMPVLGDALQDAGCDHELILDHCRAAKPHARGCWVVDAILGKT